MATKKTESAEKTYELITLRGKSGFLRLNKPQKYKNSEKATFSAQVLYYKAEDGEKQKDESLAKLKEAWIKAAKLRDIDPESSSFANGLKKALGQRDNVHDEKEADTIKGGKFAQGYSSTIRPSIKANGKRLEPTEQCPWFEYGGDIEVVLRCSVFNTESYGTICKAELAGVSVKGDIKEREEKEFSEAPVPQEDIDALFSS